MPGGHPTDYKEEFPAMLMEHLQSGLMYQSFAGEVGVCVDTLYEWEKVHPEFSDAKKRGLAMGLGHWDRIIADAIVAGKGSIDPTLTIWRFCNQYRNTVGWTRSDPVEPVKEQREPMKFNYEDPSDSQKDS